MSARRKRTEAERYLDRLHGESQSLRTVDSSGQVRIELVGSGGSTRRTPEGERSGWWGSAASLLLLTGLLTVLVTLVALGAVGLLGNDGVSDVRGWDAIEKAERSAPAAAERAAAAILTYDHRTLEADRDAALPFMTEEYGAKYTDTFEKVVMPAARETRARVTVEVLGSAVVRATETRARVLLFVDQTTVSTANETPQLSLNRVELLMVKKGESWLVEDISSF